MTGLVIICEVSWTTPHFHFILVSSFKEVSLLLVPLLVIVVCGVRHLVVTILLILLGAADLLYGAHRHELHLLKSFYFTLIQLCLSQNPSVRVKLPQFLLKHVVSALQVLNELVLGLHHDNLLGKLLLHQTFLLLF